jgi:hypothetical protein
MRSLLALATTVVALPLECGVTTPLWFSHRLGIYDCRRFEKEVHAAVRAAGAMVSVSSATNPKRRHAAALQNAGPWQRTFAVGVPQRYRVTLTVRSEIEGKRPLAIGAQTYVEGVVRSAEVAASWRATVLVKQLDADGTAEVEESLDEFSAVEESISPEDDETKQVAAALRDAFNQWLAPRTLRYRESPSGNIVVKLDSTPALAEPAPPVLSFWLARALRPAVALPQRPLRIGDRWQEPRDVKLAGWSNLQGSESGEWLEAPGAAEAAVRLYVVQQISGTAGAVWTAPGGPAPQARFHADGLATIALNDGRLLRAERSGLREVSVSVEAAGLKEAQRFAARLMAYVHIHECQNDPCLAPPRP